MTKSERRRATALAKAAKPTEPPAPAPVESTAIPAESLQAAPDPVTDAEPSASLEAAADAATAEDEAIAADGAVEPWIQHVGFMPRPSHVSPSPEVLADIRATISGGDAIVATRVAKLDELSRLSEEFAPVEMARPFAAEDSAAITAASEMLDPDRPRLCRVHECAVTSAGQRHEVGSIAIFSAEDIASLPSLLIPID